MPMLCQNPQGTQLWPCGRCKACRINRKRDWLSRMMLEAASSEAAFFITLTYRIFQYSESGLPNLEPEHVNRWMKRFRKLYAPGAVRYFLCGEYGSKTQRPHYHAVIYFKKLPLKNDVVFTQQVLSSWGLGSIHVGDVTPESLAYILGYIVKGMTKLSFFPDGRYKEFSRFSKGLGGGAYDEFQRCSTPRPDGLVQFPSTYRVVGKNFVVPKYLRRKAKVDGYETTFSEAQIALQTVLNVLPRSSNFTEYDERQEVLKEFRENVLREAELIEVRRTKSTRKMERGVIERKKSETL